MRGWKLSKNLSRRGLRVLIAAALVLAGGLWGHLTHTEAAPAVSYTLLDGQKTSLQAHLGKVVLVNFWATTCAVCVAEMPQIAGTHQRFNPRGYETLAVAMQYDPPARVAHFATTRALPFPVAIDNTSEIARRFGSVEQTPTSFLIDKRGRIVARFTGAPDFQALNAQIERLLAEV